MTNETKDKFMAKCGCDVYPESDHCRTHKTGHAYCHNFSSQITELLQRVILEIEGEKKVLPKQINMTPFPDDLIEAFRVKEQGFNEGLNLAQERIRKLIK